MLNLREDFTPFGMIDDACRGSDNLGVTGKLRWSESCSRGLVIEAPIGIYVGKLLGSADIGSS